MKMYQLLGAWLEDRSRCCAPRSMTQYEGACRFVLLPAIGMLSVESVTRDHVVAIHDAHRSRPTKANFAVKVGRMAWAFGEDHHGLTARNPFQRIKPHPTVNRRNPVSTAEACRVWAVCEQAMLGREAPCSPVWGAYFVLLLLTGMRMREATGLAWADIDLDEGRIRLEKHKTSSTAGAKVLPLSTAAVEHLSRVREAEWSDRWVFPSCIGVRSGRRSRSGHVEHPWQPWQRVCKAAGVGHRTLHDLRRGFASIAHDSGHDIRTIANLLGHRSIVTTEKYVRGSLPRAQRASDSVANAIRGGA